MKKLLGRAWRRFIRLIAVPNSHRVYGPNVMYPIPKECSWVPQRVTLPPRLWAPTRPARRGRTDDVQD